MAMLLLVLLFTLSIQIESNFGETTNIVPGDFIVEMNSQTTEDDFKHIQSLTSWSKILKVGNSVFVHIKGYQDDVGAIKNIPSVKHVEPNYITRVQQEPELSKKKYQRPKRSVVQNNLIKESSVNCIAQDNLGMKGWGLLRISNQQRNYTDGYYQYLDTGNGVDVYVLDTGIDIGQVEFGGRAMQAMRATNITSPNDYNGHGTHIAGVIGGTTYGVAKQANLISCKVLGDDGLGTTASIIEGFSYVLQEVLMKNATGAQPRSVINLSFGIKTDSNSLENAIMEAVEAGIIVVTMAGNDQQDAGMSYPAAYHSTITVAATDDSDRFSFISNYGSNVDILAPGILIFAAGSDDSYDCAGQTATHCVTFKSGTDMAASFVSGVIARYLSGLTTDQMALVNQEFVKYVLQDLATKDKVTDVPVNTKNSLLYMGCSTDIVPTPAPTTPAPTTHPPTTTPPTTSPGILDNKAASLVMNFSLIFLLFIVIIVG